MARPRKPTLELERNGAFAKNPNRRRADPETKGPVGDPPPSLPENHHAIWYELVEHSPLNVLRNSDRVLLEIACRILFAIRAGGEVEPAMFSQMTKCLSLMGMSPVDRSKIHAPKEKVDNPFAKFAGKAAEARKPVH